MSKNHPIKVVFLGTPEFGGPALLKLINDPEFEVLAVVTQPDKKVGRSQLLTPPPIKQIAQKHNILIYQPEKVRTEIEKIAELKPDLIIVIAYGQILPQALLDIPKYGCLNIHGSLLPKYRGASCLQAPILNGDKKTGLTIMKMDAGLDTGPILKKFSIDLDPQETASSLHDKLAELGSQVLLPTIKDYVKGNLKPKKQPNHQASYVKIINKEDGHINWHWEAKKIERQIRAYYPWPGAFGYLTDDRVKINGALFKILAVRPEIIKVNAYKIGEVFLYNSALAIQCGQNALVVVKLQIEGKKVIEVDDFLRGNSNIIGAVLK